jgi:polyphosphate kinase 2 (PPK2 family)
MTNGSNNEGDAMFEAPASAYLVPFDGSFRVSEASTSALTERHPHKGKHRKRATDSLKQLQRVLAAGDRHAVLLVFQAMDAAGKDSTIRAVQETVEPGTRPRFSLANVESPAGTWAHWYFQSQSLRGGTRRQGASADSRLAEDTGRAEPRDYLE